MSHITAIIDTQKKSPVQGEEEEKEEHGGLRAVSTAIIKYLNKHKSELIKFLQPIRG